MEEDVLDPLEAAEVLKVSRGTLLRLANEGKIPGKKIGRQWRFSRQMLLEWLKSGQAKKE